MLIISNKPGQLGNRLWVFAHLVAYAIEHNVKIYNPSFDEYAHLFEKTKTQLIPSYPNTNSTLTSKQLTHLVYKVANAASRISNKLKFDNSIFRTHYLDWTDNINLDEEKIEDSALFTFLNGWLFRGDKLLQKHQDKIRKFFQPNQLHLANVKNFIGAQKKEQDILIGVHIRRGDYKTFEDGRYYYELCYYDKIMRYIDEVTPHQKVKFIICSNETIGKKNITVKNWSNGPGNYFEDLLTLSSCDLIIAPPSTFSLWAAFYGGKKLFQIDSDDAKIIRKKLNSLLETSELNSFIK